MCVIAPPLTYPLSGHVQVDSGWCVEDHPRVFGMKPVGAGVVDEEAEAVGG